MKWCLVSAEKSDPLPGRKLEFFAIEERINGGDECVDQLESVNSPRSPTDRT
jgi:hypothetical protein